MQETIYLLSVPEMRESIINGLNAPTTDVLTKEDFLIALEKQI